MLSAAKAKKNFRNQANFLLARLGYCPTSCTYQCVDALAADISELPSSNLQESIEYIDVKLHKNTAPWQKGLADRHISWRTFKKPMSLARKHPGENIHQNQSNNSLY